MSWALKGLVGPLKDMTFPLKSPMTLGRQGDIAIADSKASSFHARILQNELGQWTLEDNSSKNGTRIDGDRITTATLTVGLAFYIGDQGFEVIEITEKASEPQSAQSRRYWYDVLATFLGENSGKFGERKRPVTPLEPAVVFDFARGVQANSHWILGYGPRKIGATSLDLPIWEPGAPAVCFEIFPTLDGILFKTSHPDMVKLNGQSVDSQVLRVGDTIQILETLIEVDFNE